MLKYTIFFFPQNRHIGAVESSISSIEGIEEIERNTGKCVIYFYILILYIFISGIL